MFECPSKLPSAFSSVVWMSVKVSIRFQLNCLSVRPSSFPLWIQFFCLRGARCLSEIEALKSFDQRVCARHGISCPEKVWSFLMQVGEVGIRREARERGIDDARIIFSDVAVSDCTPTAFEQFTREDYLREDYLQPRSVHYLRIPLLLEHWFVSGKKKLYSMRERRDWNSCVFSTRRAIPFGQVLVSVMTHFLHTHSSALSTWCWC